MGEQETGGARPGENDPGARPDEDQGARPGTQDGEPDYKALAEKWETRARENFKARKRAEELESRLKEFEDAGKTELERAIARAEKAERERDEASLKSLRAEIAADKGLPAKMAARLRGKNAEELEADADELLALLGRSNGTDHANGRDPDQGKGNGTGSTSKSGDMNSWIRQAAGRR